MPLETIITVIAVLSMFGLFAGTVAWASVAEAAAAKTPKKAAPIRQPAVAAGPRSRAA